MMVCVLVPLVLTVLLTETSASLSSSAGTEQVFSCPPRWLLFGQRCFAFYPVWSSWSDADLLCSQAAGKLTSLHTPEERQFVRLLANTHTPVWLGGYQEQQNWFWSDDSPFRMSDWTKQWQGNTSEGGACMEMEPKSGKLHSAPCGELRFYICSTTTSSSSKILPSDRKPGIMHGLSLFDVLWGNSYLLAEEIRHLSSFLKELRSGQLTQRCYNNFFQQEALYLHRVSSTLETLMYSLQEADENTRSLLQDTLQHYRSRNQSPLTSPPPQWLHFALQSFHSVVLEEPIYWLVALSARACLRDFLAELKPGSKLVSGSEDKACSIYQQWSVESLKEVAWIRRYRKVLEEYQDQIDVFKAINIFHEHMMNQKSFYKAADCDIEDEKL
ncbi:uncharacterized protein LOC123979733 isoform X1 [Micropterus dolomieu]|uniref:uncharacterized protein LOC123979733 isoform X1 n=1 Tax=Micropterus dolomieu TaxID=147949 RepID=UPI001E8EC92B|nr:uncharacterized protein LOC123979733 isoform X1 [Micropterus dolomieu]XP_045919705.1 uncharacterized protein LOC123979733 isoform X1 [Micropterus dolomieu]